MVTLSQRVYKKADLPSFIPPAAKGTPIYKILIRVIFLVSLASWIFTLIYKPPFVDQGKITNQVKETEPVQKKVELLVIKKSVGNFRYQIQPLYSYELSGLVVSEYTSANWLDVFHKQDPANIRDLCVVWGKFINSGVYQLVKYGHGEFTCTFNLKRQADWKKITEVADVFDYLSNNHLIPADENIAKKINQAKIGDQVYFKGYLSSYQVYSADNQMLSQRGTSITRDDTGNGACETIYVTDFEVLQKENTGYWILEKFVPKILIVSTILMLGLFFLP